MTKNYLTRLKSGVIAGLLLVSIFALYNAVESSGFFLKDAATERKLHLAYNGTYGYIEDNSPLTSFGAPIKPTAAAFYANEVQLVKTVQSLSGTPVNTIALGSEFFYVLSYRNVSGSPVNGYSITDVLPAGLTLIGTNLPGNTTYNTNSRLLTVSVGNLSASANGTVSVRVRLDAAPSSFRDACATVISNQAYSNYSGLQEPSLNNATATTPAPTVFNVSTASINDTRTESICGGRESVISAGDGFDQYTWTKNGAFVGNTQDIAITTTGTYVVTKQVDCNGTLVSVRETVNVYDCSSISNPILPFADDIGTCANNGAQMANILLCGAESSRLLDTGFEDTVTVYWEKQKASCTSLTNCANTSSACWDPPLSNASAYEVSQPGSYRVRLVFSNGSQRLFYFNVYKDQLNASVTATDYTTANLGTITVNGGGVGPQYTYTLTGPGGLNVTYGPTSDNNYTFANLSDGTYNVTVSSDSGCSYTESVVIEDLNPIVFETTGYNIKDCNRARIRLQRSGGNPPYTFALWSINGVPLYDSFQDIPDSAFSAEESESVGGNQSRVFEILIAEQGDYVFVLKDRDGNFAVSTIQTIELDPRYNFEVNTSDVSCYGGNDGAVSLNFTTNEQIGVSVLLYDGDTYVYGGTNTPIAPVNASGTFPNLEAGNYTLEVTITTKRGNSTCTFIRNFSIDEPDAPLVGFAGVTTDVSCLPEEAASLVRIANVSGGTPPYEYNINGTWGSSREGYRSNDGYIYVRDANGCMFEMFVDVNAANEIPVVEPTVDYNCDGTGNITLEAILNDPNLVYLYQYSLDGAVPQASNVFENLAPGNYTITVYYENATPDNPTPAQLLVEDFGTGANTTLAEINPVYVYESQVLNQDPPAGDADAMLDDGEYVVTAALRPLGGQQWVVPSDANNAAGGRYLAVNIGNVVGEGGIVYSKAIRDITNGRDIMVDLSVFNLLYASSTQCDPDLVVELVDSAGNIVSSANTGAINNDESWHHVTLALNAGGNTNLTFRVRSNSTCLTGNDIAIDGIRVYQVPEICTAVVEVPVVVEESQQFSGQIIAQNDITCFGLTDGSLEFVVNNFDPATGFEYSTDGGANWTLSMTSPISLNGLSVGDVEIIVRNPSDNNCTFTINTTTPIGQPDQLGVSFEVTQGVSCNPVNPGATIVVQGSGGTAPYTYALTDGTTASPVWQSNNVFTNVPSGSYEVLIQDANGCTFNATAPIQLTDPEPVGLSLAPTICYTPGNGQILATATSGNGNYQFSLDNTTWFDANPSGGNTYTFTGLTPGNYTVYMRDGLSCSTQLDTVIAAPVAVAVTSQANVDCFGSANGSAEFTITNGVAPFTYTVNAGSPATAAGNTISLSNLSAGSYAVNITDANGCTATATAVIDAPSEALALDMQANGLTCDVNSRGSVVLSATGGYSSYNYTLTDPNGVTSSNTNGRFNNLTVFGTYTVRVTDAGGCYIEDTFTLTQPVPPSLSLDTAGCYDGSNTVTLTATATGGNGTLEYRLNGGAYQASNVFNVTPGTYTVTVRDALNCTDVQTVTVNAQLQLNATAGVLPSCGGTAMISAAATGGDGNFVYAILPASQSVTDADFNASNNTAGVTTAGDYIVYVRDNNGLSAYCETQFPVTVIQDAAMTITLNPVNITCFGGNDGSISAAVTGGNPPYQYSLDGINYRVSNAFNGLVAQDYTVYVRDASGCVATATVTLTEPVDLTLNANISAEYLCTNNGATITASAGGGNGTYEFSLNGGSWVSNGTNTMDFADVTDGTHTIRVRDAAANSCTEQTTVTVNPLPVAPVLTASVDYNCDGTAAVTVSPADPAYQYALDGGAFGASNTFNNVSVGSHTITVDYGSACTLQVPFVVEPGQDFIAQLTGQTQVSCFGGNDGSFTFSVDNFDAVNGFQYSTDGGSNWINSASSPFTISNLAAGSYTVDIRYDSTGNCTTQVSATIVQPTQVVANAGVTVAATCTTGATISASASGGTPAYTYQLEDTSGNIINGYTFSATRNFVNVPVGDYLVKVQDALGCETVTPVSVLAPNALEASAVVANCYAGDNNGQITVTLDPNNTGATGNGQVYVSLNGGVFTAINNLPGSGQHTFSGLLPGAYAIDVRDESSCNVATINVTIDPQVTATVAVTNISCTDGSVTATASGGDGNLVYAFVPAGSNPDGSFGASNTFSLVAGSAGDYDVYVRDNGGVAPYCEFTETVTVEQIVPIAITATPEQPECFGDLGSFELAITNGSAPYDIVVSGPSGTTTLDNFTGNTRSFFNLTEGTYNITVTDNQGCPDNATVTIDVPDPLVAEISPILPANCTGVDDDFGFEFINVSTTLGPLEYSANGGSDWQSSPVFTGSLYLSGTEVYPSVRVVGTSCQLDLPRYTIPYPLDDLDITISTVVVNCNELRVTVQGTNGVPAYEYAYTDDPANFNPATASWTSPPTAGSHTWMGLIPGRTYVFYVRDASGCIRQSSVNVNDITVNPMEITATYEPSCFGANDATITYNITDTDGVTEAEMHWELYLLSTGAMVQSSGGNVPYADVITVTSLAPGEYYIVVTQVDPLNADTCISATENLIVEEQDPISGTPVKLQDITCNDPGLIAIQNLEGGSGNFTFTLSSPDFTGDITTQDNPVSVPLSQLTNPLVSSVDVTVTATDEYGCSQVLGTVTLNVSQPPVLDNVVVNNCLNQPELNITASGGLAPYFYSVDGGATWSSNSTFKGLVAGSYDISVLDSNGCRVDGAAAVDVFPALQAEAEITKLIDCTVTPDGIIEVNVLSGSGSYDYVVTLDGNPYIGRTAITALPFNIAASAAGVYQIEIFDNGTSNPECSVILTEVMPAAIYPAFNATPFDASCAGGNDGMIQVTPVNNGAGALTYTISPAAGSWDAASSSFTGLTAGSYTITATGANSCTTPVVVTVGEPAALTGLSLSATPFSCVAGNTPGVITVTASGVTGGTGNYVYTFSYNGNSQTGISNEFIISDLSGGTVDVTVTDENGCPFTNSIIIAPVFLLEDAGLTAVNPSCIGNDGSITANVQANMALGSELLRFDIVQLGGSYNDTFTGNTLSHTFSNLEQGNYQVTVTNVNTGCFVQSTTTLSLPEAFEVQAQVSSNVVCEGTNSGLVDLVVTNINDTFTWVITDAASAVVASGNETNTSGIALGAGDYIVTVTKDSDNYCVVTDSFSILAPPAPLAAERVFDPVTCVGNDGVIEIINVSGGWGGYTYYVGVAAPADTDYVSNNRFEGLAVGTYQVWVRDQEGCAIALTDVVLVDPAPITADVIATQQNCDGLSGVIEVSNVAGGQGSNYSIQLIRDGVNFGAPVFGTSAIFSGLGAGSYQVLVYDQWSCSETFDTALDFEEPVVASVAVVSDLSCDPANASSGGQISVTATGGTGVYTYNGVDPAGNALTSADGIFSGLTLSGTYTFQVTDANGCSDTVSIDLTQPVLPAIDQVVPSNVTCAGNDGSIIVTLDPATAVNPPYTYELFNSSGVLVSTNLDGIFLNLQADTYSVRVSSDLECWVEQANIVVDTDPTPEISLEVSDNCDISGEYSITVELTQAGIAPYVLSVNGAVRNVTFDANNQYVITGLAQGTYDITITDANGCGMTANNDIQIIPLDALAQVNSLLYCFGSAGISISEITGSGSYEYEISGPNGINQPRGYLDPAGTTWNGASEAGSYTVTIYDMNGNCSIARIVEVPARLEPQIEILSFFDQTCASGADGVITVNAIDNGIGPFIFEITAIDGVSAGPILPLSNNGYTATFDGLDGSTAGITYTITATAANGCQVTIDQVITAPEAIAISNVEVNPFACDAGSNVTNYALVVVGAGDVTGGSGNYVSYEFIVNGVVAQRSANPEFYFTDLNGGSVTINVYDDKGCSGTTVVSVDPFVGIGNPQLVVDKAITCDMGEDVTVSVEVTGGTANLEYTLVNTSGAVIQGPFATTDNSYNFIGIPVGAYFINILNTDTGCEVSIGHTVQDPNHYVLTAQENSPVVCYGTETGTVELTMMDLYLADGDQSGNFNYLITGVSDPSFSLSGSSNSSTIVVSGLPAGTFRVEATLTTNGLNCVVPASEFSIIQSLSPLSATAEGLTNVTCTNDMGEIYVKAEGGYTPYTITLFNSLTGTSQTVSDVNGYVFTGLGEGTYTATVTDAGGCTVTTNEVTLIRPDFIAAEIAKVDVSCYDSNTGQVSAINVTGGAGVESYYFILNDLTHGNVYEENRNGIFTDLPAGDYSITIYDAWSCDVTTDVITVAQPQPIAISEISRSALVCYGTTDGFIEVSVAGGQVNYALSLIEVSTGTEIQSQVLDTDGGTVMFDQLSGDVEYKILVTDANGCTQELAFSIPTGPDLTAVVEVFYSCEENAPANWIEVSLANASLDINQVMYAINSTDINDALLFDEVTDGKGIVRNLPAGSAHTITIFHEGCSQTAPDTFEVEQIDPVFLADNSNQEIMNQVSVAISGGEGPYTLYFNGRNMGTGTEYFVSPSDPGYIDAEGRKIKIVTITVVDANGCSYTIEVEREFIEVEIPDYFTPDGDGSNELWTPENVMNYPRILTRVYDRYGREVGKMRLGESWDGRYNGNPLPSGDYWYVIKLNGENDNRKFVGHFTLYR